MNKIEPEKLKQLVGSYLERVTRKNSAPRYPLDMVAIYEVIGGANLEGNRIAVDNSIMKGKFIDVLVYALHQNDFYGDWCSQDDMNNCNHGFIRKAWEPDMRKYHAGKMLPRKYYSEIMEIYGGRKK